MMIYVPMMEDNSLSYSVVIDKRVDVVNAWLMRNKVLHLLLLLLNDRYHRHRRIEMNAYEVSIHVVRLERVLFARINIPKVIFVFHVVTFDH